MGSVCHMNTAEAKQNTTESYLRSRVGSAEKQVTCKPKQPKQA